MAFGVFEGHTHCGVSVPEDVSVIGFDNLPECLYSNPKLTSIAQNLPRKAQLVGENLFKMIHGETVTGDQFADVEIIERQSVRDLRK